MSNLEKLREQAFKFTVKRIKDAQKKDEMIIQSVGLLDELQKTINLLTNRLMHIVALKNYEIVKNIEDQEEFIKKINKGFKNDELGMELDKTDIELVNIFSSKLIELNQLINVTEKYIEKTMKEIAPNTSEISGEVLGAKLIAMAGGIEKLAEKPASTIQVMGAEKALFKHLHSKTPCPKHGIIFQHPYINSAKKEKRGKIARTLASKISIATKIDATTRKLNKSLKKELDEKIKNINK